MNEPALQLVDCDIHPSFRNGLSDLAPYVSESWRRRLGLGSDAAGRDMYGNRRDSKLELPKSPFYAPSPGSFRKDAFPPDGGVPASDPGFLARHHLDAYGVDRGILLGQNVLTLGAFTNPHAATVLAAAYNAWLEEHWLDVDERYRGALVVAPQDPGAAAAEVRTAAERHPGWVSVMLPVTNILLGDQHYYPIYEAAESLRLPIAIHVSGVEGTFPTAPALGGGAPATYFEYKTVLTTAYQTNLASLVIRGVFERFPRLRVVMTECGLGWLLELLWRMDANWRALREEAPWVKRAPSEYIFEHVRFTSQPFVEPPDPKQLRQFCEMVNVERVLMFASDYPHYDFDSPLRTIAQIPKHARAAVRAGNAIATFGPRLVAPGRQFAGAQA
jgi:predicted TIM-barrel fold metal-dependent hydrolase